MTTSPHAHDIGLADFEFWALPHESRVDAFHTLREHQPISFHAEPPRSDGTARSGFWALVRYDDVRAVSRNPAVFSSAKGFTYDDSPSEILEVLGSMIAMDDPRHGKLRRLVQAAFTPRAVQTLTDMVRARAHRLVVEAAQLGTCDFVETFSEPLPIGVICEMVGVPRADEKMVVDWTNHIVGANDPEFKAAGDAATAVRDLYRYAIELGEDRARHSRDDMASQLMEARLEGERLTAQEFGSFVVMLLGAGNETTRNSITWGMYLLSKHRAQKERWMRDFDARATNAIDEIVRWASPVLHMRRTATEDTRIHDTDIAAGDKVVIWYWSANRDETVFPDGDRFDIDRENIADHVGFGAGGPHFCLGAHLARLEMRVIFEEIFRWLPDLEFTGAPEPLVSPFVNGIKRVPCRFTRRSIPSEA